MKRHDPIPADYPVQPIRRPRKGKQASFSTCGYCGLSWDDDLITSITPTPAGRCAFEPFHIPDQSPPSADAWHDHYRSRIAMLRHALRHATLTNTQTIRAEQIATALRADDIAREAGPH